MRSEARIEAIQAKVPLPRPATPPPVSAVSPLPPASGFENEESNHPLPASEDIGEPVIRGRPPPRVPPRKSSSGSIASAVAAKRRLSKTVEVIGPQPTAVTSGRGYDCCSKREKSSALAALIGCISLATLMTSLVTDLWLDTDEWIPAVDPGPASPEMPNVQPRHGEVPGSTQHEDTVRRVHFAVGLWTVCPSRRDGYGNIAGKI